MNRLCVRKGAIILDRRALRRAYSNRAHRLTSLSISGVLALGMVSVVPTPVEAAACTSPTTSTNGNFTIVQFKTVESCTWAAPSGVSSVQVLIVGGGGAGGAGGWAGGGGAGSVLYGSSYSVAAGTNYTVTVGAGATGNSLGNRTAAQGSSSTFGGWTASGGGGGAGYGWSDGNYWAQGGNGGSGGGAAEDNGQPAGGSFVQTSYAGATPYGNAGGKAFSDSGSQAGAGGGGAGSAGGDAYARNGETRYPGAGGTGKTLSVGGTNFLVAGGGGGASSTSYGTGGSGIGGNGGYNGAGSAGTANTGSGGGGAQSGNGGNGGSGIVVIAYQSPASVSAPNSVSVTAAAQGLNVSWSAPTKSSASVTGYRVEYSSTGTASGSWTTATSSLGSGATSYSITGLSSSTPYYVRVAAIYSSGTGPYGYPWVKKYWTKTSARVGGTTGSIQYESGYGTGQTETSFSRVRYVMAATLNGSAQSVDANFDRTVSGSGYTSQGNLNSISNLQVPTTGNGLVIQGDVSDLTVISSTGGLVTDGYGFSGRLELWGWDYGAANPAGMSTRAAGTYDDADTQSGSGYYGSFQLHNLESTSRQTVFAWNNHGGTPEIGFGNNLTGGHTDWTFCAGNSQCPNRTGFSLEVFVNEPTTPLPGTALTPAFGAVTATPVGYTVQISNFDAAYTWGGTATAGGTVSISGTGLVTVTGVAPSTSSTVTITTTRIGYNSGSGSTSGTSSGPIASYNFSDLNSYNSATPTSLSDLSGNGRTGTVTNGSGGASPSWTQSNGTLTFPGGTNSTGPFVDLPNISSTPFNTYGTTVDFEANFGASKDGFERIIDLSEAGMTNDNLIISRDGTTSNLFAEVWVGTTGTRCTFSNAITENTLVRYTVTLTGTTCQLWKDGVSFAAPSTFNVKPAAGITWTDNFIGKSNWTGDAQYEGSIRSLRLYAGGFTPTQLGAFDYKTITYNANNGSTTPPAGITSGSLSLPATILRTGYSFQGWYNGTNYLTATKRGNASATYAPASSETIYAGWSANSNTVTFNSNYTGGPTATTQSITTDVATALTANTFNRTGYTFAGWNTSADGLGTNYTNQQSVTLNSNLALYAKWTANPNTVTFNSNYTGGPTATTQSITTDVATALTANTFNRTGYTFAGWNTMANGSGTKYTNSQSVTISAPLTLYATWYRISMTTQPVGKASGTTLQTQPSVRIEDGNGNTVTSDSTTSITVAISSGAGGTLGGTKTLTVTNGVATFTDLTLAGTTGTNYVLTFSSTPSYFAATSQNVTVTPGSISAANSTVTPGTVTMSADGVTTQTFTVTLKDAQGNTFTSTNDTVTFATNNSLGVFANATNKSPGVYEGVYTAGTSPGTDTVTVTANSVALTTKPVITLNPGVPAVGTSLVTAATTSLTANGTSTSVITVRLKDSSGNNIPRGGATVTVRVASGPGNVGSVTDNGNGTYTATYTATTTAGSSLIKATVDGVDITDTETITLVPGAATKLGVYVSPPTTTSSGTTLSTQPQVVVQDAYGNTVTSDSGRTISIGIVGNNGSLGGSSTATTSAGIATFSGITLSGLTSETYRLSFSASGLTGINSDVISVTPGSASTATSVVSVSATSIVANGTSTSVITVTLKDAQSNLLVASGGTVVISKSSGGGSVSATTNNNDGTYTATFTSPTTVGTTVIQATVAGSTISDTETISLLAGAATHIAITRAPVTGANASNFTTQPQITLLDANNNTVTANSSSTVDVALLSGANGVLSGTTHLTFVNGVVNFTNLAITGRTNTDYVLQFTSGSFTVDSANLTLTPGVASTSTSTVIATDSTLIANGSTTTTITIRLKDAQTNALTTSGGTVTVAVTSGTGSLSAVTNNNDGTYTATYTSGTVVGTDTITATLGSTAITDTESINLIHGSATKIRITQQPVGAASGTVLATQPKVEITDAFNNRVTTDSTTVISVAISAGVSGTLGGTTTATVASGEATFSDLTLAGLVAQSYKLTFSSGSLTSVQSSVLSVTPGAAVASTSSISATSTSMTANGSATSVVTVQLKDAQGNSLTVGGNTVTMRVNSGSGLIGSTADNGNGTYSATYTAGTVSGSVVIKAALSGTDLTATQTLALNPGAATKLALLVRPGSSSSGALLSPQPQVVVQDVNGNTVTSDTGRTITVAIGSGTGGSLSGTLTANTANGVATFTNVVLAGLTSSNYVLDFTTPSLTHVESDPLSVTSGSPQVSTSTFTVSQSSIVANGTTTSTVTVTLRDAQSNALTTSGGTLEMFVTSGQQGSIGVTTDNNDGTYSATYTSGTVVSNVVITAKLNGVALTQTTTISLIPGAATQLSITTQPTGKASGTTLDHQPVIELLDAFGNLATQDSTTQVTTAIQSGASGTLGGTKTLTASSGVVTFTDLTLAGLVTENYVLRFTSGSLTLADSANVTVTPGAATTMSITSGDNTSATVNTTVSTKPTVAVQDAQGNYVPNVMVTFATGTNSGIATGTSVSTNASGVATVGSWKLYTISGANTMTATATGTNSVTFTSTGIAAAPDATKSTIALSSGSVVVAGSPVGITVTIRDTYNNVVTDAAGTLVLSPTSGLGTISSPVNNNNGTYSAAFTPGTLSGSETISGSYAGSLLADQNLSVLPSVASQYLVTRASGTIVAGNAITVNAQLADQYGNSVPTSGVSVTWAATNGGSFATATSDTNASGLATISYTTNTRVANAASVSATDAGGLTGTLPSFATVPGVAVVGTSLVETSSSSLIANGTSTATITVILKDANGNELTSASQSTVTISVGMSVGSVGSTTNNGNGTYTATYTSRSTVGTATISASLGLVTITDTATISLVPGPATQVKITTEPVGSASGTALATQPVAKLLDAHDNVITGDVTSTVSVAIQSGVGGTLGGTRSITVVNGVATFTDLTLAGLVNTNYVLRFTSGSLTVADSANVMVTPGAASVATSVVSTSVTSLVADTANTTTVTVTLKDAQGNQLVVGGSTVGITVDTLTAGNGNYGSIGSVTDNSNGTYTATYTAGTKVQNVKFAATLTGSAITDDATLALVHGTATKLAVQVQPVGGASGSALTTQPVVLIQDANGNTVTSDSGRTVTAALGGQQNTGTLSGTRTATSDQGVVTFSGIVMTGRTATNYVLAFSATGLTGLNSNNFNVNPGPTNTTNSVVSASNAVITANGITTSVITVTVKDTEGNTVGATAGTVVLSVTTGTGSLSTVIDNNDGTYTSTFTSGTVAGSATIAGTLNGTALGTSAVITLTPGPAHHTAVLVQPGDTASGALLSPQAQVLIQDRYNNTVTADSTSIITASLKSGAGGTLGGTLTATASAGIATFTNVTLAGVVGTDYVIEFNPNTSGVASVDSRTINLTPGTPTQLILSTQAATAKSGQTFTTQPVLVAKDAQNNVATNFTADVSATVSTGANTQGTTTKPLVNGVATFTDLGLYGTANANYTVTYTTSSLGLTTSQSILLSPGSADHLEIVTQPTSEKNGQVFVTQPVIQIRDAQNNAVPTASAVNVVASISSGSGILSGTQTIGTDSSGRSTFTNLMITGNTGNYRMTFTAGGLSVETSAFGLTAGDQTITPSAFGSTALPNGTYTPTASSYSGLAVAITLDNSSAGVCSMADGTVTFLKSGACKINYDQAGNTHWSAAPRVTETLSIGKLAQNIAFAAIDDQPFGGTDVALSATADSGLTVTFTVSSASTICTLATATTVHIVGLGTCTVNVAQAGDDVWLAAANNDSNHPLTRSFVIGTVRPATPTIASVSAGNAQATVSWNAPSHDGGSALLDYKVTAHPGGATCVSNDAIESSCIVTGLTNGTEYRFSVQARNAIGLSNASENSPAVTPATTADAVTGLTLTSTNKKLTANWIKPVQLGGGAFVRYEMFIRETGGTYGPAFVSRDVNLETFEFTKTDPNDSTNASDLRNGESYDVKIVIITDAIMSGNASAVELLGNSTEATQIPADVPAAPTDVTILTTTGHEANVSWVASNSDGGSVITSYEVLAKANDVVVTCVMVTPLDTSCGIAVLTPGERVDISVKAVNRIGRSNAATATLTLPTVPAAATMNTVTVGNGFIHVEWSAPASDGGMALTGYIARAMVRGTDQVAAECTTSGTGCDLILSGADYDFDFAVWATNRVGSSARSNLLSPAKPTPTPTPSATRMRTPVTNAGAAAVIWDARKPMYMPSGDPVELPAGKTMAWRNGEFVEVNLVAAGTSVLQLSAAGGVVLQMQSLHLSGAPMDVSASGLMQVYHNRTIRIAGSGFAPNSIATVWMFSDEIKIGEVMTDANGAFAEVFPIGTNIPLGDHTIQINGEHKDGSVRTVAMGVSVMDEAFAPAEEEASAPNSESSNQMLGVIGAVGVAFLGGLLVGLLMIGQRRRKS